MERLTKVGTEVYNRVKNGIKVRRVRHKKMLEV